MKNRMQNNRISLQPFQNGQIWQMEDSSLEIALVGKTLVHYKHYKGQTKRSPVSLSGKDVLERFLKSNKAILVRGNRARVARATTAAS